MPLDSKCVLSTPISFRLPCSRCICLKDAFGFPCGGKSYALCSATIKGIIKVKGLLNHAPSCSELLHPKAVFHDKNVELPTCIYMQTLFAPETWYDDSNSKRIFQGSGRGWGSWVVFCCSFSCIFADSFLGKGIFQRGQIPYNLQKNQHPFHWQELFQRCLRGKMPPHIAAFLLINIQISVWFIWVLKAKAIKGNTPGESI